jgi:hypothetical protein
MNDAPATQPLPPLDEPPTADALWELSELVSATKFELVDLRERLERLGEQGYGWVELTRQTALERKSNLTAEESSELQTLKAQHERAVGLDERAGGLDQVLSFEIAGHLAVMCQSVKRDAEALAEEADKTLSMLPDLTGSVDLPAGGWEEETARRAALYERRAREAREPLGTS